ncbi:hypothetical protein LTR53_002282 [Teratosphaeriaceae sp. CCFEE 6253]|nr:hypothetical protein LTR53_002282 [Teratosphaeriaceae sp. CCFEE 6253]
MGKPNTLPANECMIMRATALADNSDLQSDASLLPLLKYQCMIENIHATYESEKRSATHSRLHLHSKRLLTGLEDWRSTIPEHLWRTGAFATRYHAAKIWIYEMGLLYHFRVSRKSPSASGLCSAAQRLLFGNLASCADAIKQYLDVVLALELAVCGALPFEEWCRFIMAFFVLYRLSIGPREVPEWDVQLCRQTIDLEMYLGRAATFLRQASRLDSGSSSQGLYYVLPDVLKSAKASYVAVRDTPEAVPPGSRVHLDLSKPSQTARGPRVNNPSTFLGERRGCPATGFWTHQALALDSDTDWHGVKVEEALDPSVQLQKNECLWSGLLSTYSERG